MAALPWIALSARDSCKPARFQRLQPHPHRRLLSSKESHDFQKKERKKGLALGREFRIGMMTSDTPSVLLMLRQTAPALQAPHSNFPLPPSFLFPRGACNSSDDLFKCCISRLLCRDQRAALSAVPTLTLPCRPPFCFFVMPADQQMTCSSTASKSCPTSND